MTTIVKIQVYSRTQALAVIHVKPDDARNWTNKALGEEMVKLGYVPEPEAFMIVKDGNYERYKAIAKSQDPATA